MGVTKAAIKELEDATSALWGATRDIREYRAAPAWKHGSRLLILPGRKRKRRRLSFVADPMAAFAAAEAKLTTQRQRFGVSRRAAFTTPARDRRKPVLP
jgi:hypothetical protein